MIILGSAHLSHTFTEKLSFILKLLFEDIAMFGKSVGDYRHNVKYQSAFSLDSIPLILTLGNVKQNEAKVEEADWK